jgi:cyclopropane fatty-acyl-phospholipid synthase-like methyltransferase
MDSVEAYEFHAQEFLRRRDESLVGSRVVDEWSRSLPAGANVLELACGGGEPITRVLGEAGLHLWAIDSSPTLIAAFRSRFPAVPASCERVQDSDFFGRTYDAVVAIGLIFLLVESDQAALIARIGDIVVPGGRFLFTAPTQVHEWTDVNTGAACKSLGQARYEELLRAAGFRVLGTLVDIGENNYYDAGKVSQEA